MNHFFKPLTPGQARIIRAALRRHDGATLHPELDRDQARELTLALDKLRGLLLDIEEQEDGGSFEDPKLERLEAWAYRQVRAKYERWRAEESNQRK